MNGPEHYQEAERLVHVSHNFEPYAAVQASAALGAAQVHATLALAAATALSSHERDGDHDSQGMDPADRHAWEQVAGVPA